MMKTGFGDDGNGMAERYISSMIEIMLPVVERATVLACEYSKACGRDVLLPEDMEYAIKYCAMHTVGQTTGSLFPELWEEEGSDEDEMDVEEVDIEDEEIPEEDCPPFVRYEGPDNTFNMMNDAYDRWDQWVPQSPAEELIKKAVDSNEHL